MSPIEVPGLPLALPEIQREAPVVKNPTEVKAPEFDAIFEQALVSTNAQIRSAEHASAEFAAGRLDDIHGTMLELSKADIQLRFVGNVRNKVMEAFYELWRMQI